MRQSIAHHEAVHRQACARPEGKTPISALAMARSCRPSAREMKRSMEALIHHFKLLYRRLSACLRRRGLRRGGSAQGRIRRLSRSPMAPTSRIGARSALPVSRICKRDGFHVSRATCSRMFPRFLARSISCSGKWTGEDFAWPFRRTRRRAKRRSSFHMFPPREDFFVARLAPCRFRGGKTPVVRCGAANAAGAILGGMMSARRPAVLMTFSPRNSPLIRRMPRGSKEQIAKYPDRLPQAFRQ